MAYVRMRDEALESRIQGSGFKLQASGRMVIVPLK